MSAAAVDWSTLTAEQCLEAFHSRPVVLGAWREWGFAVGWSREEVYPWQEGRRAYVSVQPCHTGNPDDRWWRVNLDGIAGPSHRAESEADARRMADEIAASRGWKLLGGAFPG